VGESKTSKTIFLLEDYIGFSAVEHLAELFPKRFLNGGHAKICG